MEERKGSFAMCLDQLTELYGILSCSDKKIRLKVGSAQSTHIVLKFVGNCSDTALQYERGEVLL